jgi:uncharacterized membrane protein
MSIKTWRFVMLMLTTLSVGLSMAHLLELPPRMKFDQHLWVEVTVLHGVYTLFGTIGAFFECGSVMTAFIVAFLVRKRGQTVYWTLGGAVVLLAALVSWILFVAPMNTKFATWLTNPIPSNWTRYRDQWEYTHALNACIKIIGLSLLLLSVIRETPDQATKLRAMTLPRIHVGAERRKQMR